MPKLKTTIGLEIHVQLATKSKMFCRCDNEAFGKKPNTTVCPICLGMPGTLPVTNKQAVEYTIKTGMSLNCKINEIAKFDRKHYFYPDLPKGYQISQYDEPFCSGGYVEIDGRKIQLNRIHLEEDAGKLVHSGGKSLVDLNRAGTPLMEIVTEPDIESPEEAKKFMQKLRETVRHIGVSFADMEKGHLRCDANISISELNAEGKTKKMSEIVEIKNLNSFRFVEKALTLEEERLKASYLLWPEKRQKVTRGFDSVNIKTYAQRQKEEASDYRYFPEPDLPPFVMKEFDLDAIRNSIGKTGEDLISELTELGAVEADVRTMLKNKEKKKLFNDISEYVPEKSVPDLIKSIVNNYLSVALALDGEVKLREYGKAVQMISSGGLAKNQFIEAINAIHDNDVSLEEALATGGDQGDKVENLVKKVLEENKKELDAYRSGKTQLFGFFMGQVMRLGGGKLDPKLLSQELKKKLDK